MSFSGWMKRSVYWTKDFFHGRRVRKFYDDLDKVLANRESGEKHQQKSLFNLLEHMTENTEFYKEYKGVKELQKYPVVNKNILIANQDKLTVPADKIPEQVGDKVHIQKTSGSTGTPFCIPQDTRKRNRRVAELKYFNELLGIKSHEKLAQCRIWTKWQSKSKWQIFKENIIPINVAKMDDETVNLLLTTVRDEKVKSIRAYASWYDAVVKYLEENKERANDLKTIIACISSSETLNEDTRIKMKELANVSIVEAYASEEAGMMAQQRIDDTNYYLNHSGYVFEFLKMDSDKPAEEGELSRIVITDLFNYAFPLIRYDTGDTAVYQEGNESSNGWRYISKLYGRRMDLVYSTSGVPLHPMNFARVLKNLPGIIQWQFIQKSEKTYVVRLNLSNEDVIEVALKELKSIVGDDAEIVVERVNDIPVIASGKRKLVVREWDK